MFRCPHGHQIPDASDRRSRRATAMVKAVGETLVVDTLFLVLGLVTGSWDEPSLVAISSSVFSILERVTELQYYLKKAEDYLETDIPRRNPPAQNPASDEKEG